MARRREVRAVDDNGHASKPFKLLGQPGQRITLEVTPRDGEAFGLGFVCLGLSAGLLIGGPSS